MRITNKYAISAIAAIFVLVFVGLQYTELNKQTLFPERTFNFIYSYKETGDIICPLDSKGSFEKPYCRFYKASNIATPSLTSGDFYWSPSSRLFNTERDLSVNVKSSEGKFTFADGETKAINSFITVSHEVDDVEYDTRPWFHADGTSENVDILVHATHNFAFTVNATKVLSFSMKAPNTFEFNSKVAPDLKTVSSAATKFLIASNVITSRPSLYRGISIQNYGGIYTGTKKLDTSLSTNELGELRYQAVSQIVFLVNNNSFSTVGSLNEIDHTFQIQPVVSGGFNKDNLTIIRDIPVKYASVENSKRTFQAVTPKISDGSGIIEMESTFETPLSDTAKKLNPSLVKTQSTNTLVFVIFLLIVITILYFKGNKTKKSR